jgi:hypothetical protein
MTRMMWRPPCKLFPDLLLKESSSCTLGSRQTLPCWALFSCNRP